MILRCYKNLYVLLLPVLLLLTAANSWGSTAANTEIVNTATLTYNGTEHTSASCSVTVALLPATPNIAISRADAVYTEAGSPSVTNTVTITATANGSAVYTLATAVTASTNTLTAETVQPTVSGGDIYTLGASVTTGGSGTNFLVVPAPIGVSEANPTAINGIAVGETIVFTVDGTTYSRVVSSITYNGNRTYSINWSDAPTAVAPAGTQIGESIVINLLATPGTIDTLGVDLTTTVQAIVSTADAPADAVAVTSPPNTWISYAPNIQYKKYSRNASNPDGNPAPGSNGATVFEVDSRSNAYFTSGVTARQGEKIEYLLEAVNIGTTDLTGCSIFDRLPVNIVTDPIPAYGGDYNIFYTDTNGLTSKLHAGSAVSSQAGYISPNLTVYVGVDATDSTGGLIPLTKRVTVAYQVKVK